MRFDDHSCHSRSVEPQLLGIAHFTIYSHADQSLTSAMVTRFDDHSCHTRSVASHLLVIARSQVYVQPLGPTNGCLQCFIVSCHGREILAPLLRTAIIDSIDKTGRLIPFSLNILLRVSFSPGRDRPCRHCWISCVWTPLGKRLLYLTKRSFRQYLSKFETNKLDIQYLKSILKNRDF